MAAHDPIDLRVRLAISQWPEDAPRGAVSTFWAEHGISRESFHALRHRARTEGAAAVLEPRTALDTGRVTDVLTQDRRGKRIVVSQDIGDYALHGHPETMDPRREQQLRHDRFCTY